MSNILECHIFKKLVEYSDLKGRISVFFNQFMKSKISIGETNTFLLIASM
jgi:hypothetical protein